MLTACRKTESLTLKAIAMPHRIHGQIYRPTNSSRQNRIGCRGRRATDQQFAQRWDGMQVDRDWKLPKRRSRLSHFIRSRLLCLNQSITHLLLAVALMAALILPPTRTVADARFSLLSEPGIVAIMRHAHAPGTGDPASFRLDDCASQRNLGARGAEQARQIGAAIRAADVTVDRVLTSQWCRCRDTAKLLDLGPVEELPALNSFFRYPDRSGRQTADLRQFLFDLPPEETVLLVTHYVNIRALAGRSAASGEVLLLKIESGETISVVGEILIYPRL